MSTGYGTNSMVSKFNSKKDGTKVVDKGPGFGKRHVQVILMFLLIAIAYGMRVNLSVAIVAMTDNTISSNPNVPTYEWTDKSVILSSFYWGYVILQVFAGKLGRTYGTRWFLVGSMAINSAAFTAIPLVADQLGSKGVMACRMIQGLAQGFVYPSVAVLLGQWVPLTERARLSTITMSGMAFSCVFSMPVSGYICGSWLGWPATFYLFGALGFAWILPWLIFGSNSPEEHKTITKEERSYIQESLDFEEEIQITRTPWKAILTSLPVWAYVVANYGQAWGFATLLTEMPTYISKIMKFDIHSNSVLSAAPYAALFIFSYICGFISDYVINAGYLSPTRARKVFTSIGLMGPGLSLLLLGFVPESATALSITLLVGAVSLGGATYSGFQLASIDLSPTFSGVIMGISNGSANIFSILSPLFVQFIVTDETDKFQWRIIFIVSAGACFVANLFFVIFGMADVQWWDSINSDKEKGAANPTRQERQKKMSQASRIMTIM